jgi:UDP-N-acetylmuramoylalanine--D-glutamate ligase
MSKILILGLGVSGKSCAAYLLKHQFQVTAVDRNFESLFLKPDVKQLIDLGLELKSDSIDFPLHSFSQLIVSPGIDPSHPLIQKAKHLNIEVIGEIEFGFRHLQNFCVGITGSNGKTTTTLSIVHILNNMGLKAKALGNVGASLTGYLMNVDPEEILIVELSSFQLETLQIPVLDAALILNITPNHLDRHPSMESYVKAKMQIQNCLKEGGQLFVSKQVVASYGNFLKKYKLFDEIENFSVQNLQAAYSICSLFGISLSDFQKKMASFQRPSHRMEWVAEINGVTYYNDSKATNVDAVLYAVNQLSGPILLIAGGVDKGASYRPWIASFAGKVKKIVVFGEAAEKINGELKDFFLIEKVKTLEEALFLLRKISVEKDTILFSPGCSSFDQFVNYEARGEAFKQMVKR